MNATEIPSGSQHNFYFPSSTLLNILGMVVRRCRHLLRFRSWFVDHPAASRQVSHPSCRHHRIHRHIHLCPYLHPCHPCLDRKQTVGRILFCWNSPLLNAKNQDRTSQIEQKVNTWIFRPCLFSGPGPKSRFFKPWKWFQTLISKSDPAYSLNNGKLLKHTTPPRSFPPSGSLASRLKRLISLKFAEWKLHKNIMSLVWSKNNRSCI